MKTPKVLGIIALMAVMVLGMVACEQEVEDTELGGAVIIVSDYVDTTKDAYLYVGDNTIYVTYTGTDVTPTKDTKIEVYKGGTVWKTFTASDETSFTVAAGDVDQPIYAKLTDGAKSGQSATLTVKNPAYLDFLGFWKTKQPLNTGTDYEKIYISPDKFQLDCDDGEYLYLTLNATTWLALTGNNLTIDGETYAKGYSITIATVQNQGYNGFNAGATIKLFQNTSGSISLFRTNPAGNVVTDNKGAGQNPQYPPRAFERIDSPYNE